MGIFDGYLLASDIDGTLLDNGYINPRNIEKIKFFVNEGGAFAIATGRSVGAVSMVTDVIDCIGPSVVANGAMIYDYNSQEIIKEYLLPECDKRVVGFVINISSDIGVEIHSGKNVLVANATSETDDHEQYEKLSVEKMPLSEAIKYSWTKVLFAFSDAEKRAEIRNRIMGLNIESDLFDTIAYIDGRTRYYLEVVPKGISKADSLQNLCSLLGIKKGGFFAIGDYYNDLTMLKNADIGATTAEAPDEIKQCADFVGGSCKNGAVADFIEYLTKIFTN